LLSFIGRELNISFLDALNLTWFQVAAVCEMLEKRAQEMKRREIMAGQKKLQRMVNGRG